MTDSGENDEPAYVETMRRADETQMAYERGYRAGIMAALDNPDEARDYLSSADHYLAWLVEPPGNPHQLTPHDPF